MGLLDTLHLGKRYTVFFAYRLEPKPVLPGVYLGRRWLQPAQEELLALARQHAAQLVASADNALERQFTTRLFVEAKRKSSRTPGKSKTRLKRVAGMSFTIVELHPHIYDVKPIG